MRCVALVSSSAPSAVNITSVYRVQELRTPLYRVRSRVGMQQQVHRVRSAPLHKISPRIMLLMIGTMTFFGSKSTGVAVYQSTYLYLYIASWPSISPQWPSITPVCPGITVTDKPVGMSNFLLVRKAVNPALSLLRMRSAVKQHIIYCRGSVIGAMRMTRAFTRRHSIMAKSVKAELHSRDTLLGGGTRELLLAHTQREYRCPLPLLRPYRWRRAP